MSIKLKGSSDGSVSFDAPADTSPSGSDITLVLPTTVGSAEQFLKNSGTAGTLEFSSMVETSTGVGIGTNSPSHNLDILSTTSGTTVSARVGSTATSGVNNANLIINNGGTGNATLRFDYESSTNRASIGVPQSTEALFFTTSGDERMRIDSSGRLLVGTSSAAKTYVSLGLQGNGASATNQATIALAKGALPSGADQELGRIEFLDNSGNSGGTIVAISDAAWTSGSSHATDLTFSTTASGASSSTERMRIESAGNAIFKNSSYVSFNDNGYIRTDSSGYLRLQSGSNGIMFTNSSNSEVARINSSGYFKARNTNASYISAASGTHEFNDSSTANSFTIRATNSSYAATVCNIFAVRAHSSSYNLIRGLSSSGTASADDEFYIRGDGRAFADESWNGGGADYAEYFEWSDGNTEAEDRRGISVVLDGDKIRKAVTGEEPIGVISGHPSVVGDADMTRWKNKYLRDDYGSYVLDEDGYRQLNPNFDSSVEYVKREDRPEWDTVGLMGKLRIRKGQVTGTRWIKMRDVSDTVEEWLVR